MAMVDSTLPALAGVVLAIGAGVPLTWAGERELQSVDAFPPRTRLLVVAGFALAVALLVLRLGLQLGLAPILALAAFAVPLSLVDMAEHRLPNRLVLTAGVVVGVLLVVVALIEGDLPRLVGTVLGGAGLFALYLLLALVARGGIGMGDVKLAAVIGAVLAFAGWRLWVLGMLAGFVLNGLVSVVALLARRTTLRGSIPFGPSMLAGALLAVALF